ncbi:hypothetical protein [Cloacibacterium normanense]|uniref:hypothetical protein n=1 Tax=Cloacibacterium normanense TaxID=237258 RepID=UPI003919DD4D
MATLRLDYEKLFEAFDKQNKKIIGVFTLQYPVYCIHATIEDVTVDPLDHFDQLLVQIIASKGNVSAFVLSSLLGVSKSVVEDRIQMLVYEDLLVQNTNYYTLTEKAIAVYINKTVERVHIRSYDFYVDGLTLKPLKKVFYKNYKSKLVSENDNYFRTTKKDERIIERSMKPDMVHCPINVEQVVSNIKEITVDERDLFGIPWGFRNIIELSHTKMTFQVLVVASTDGQKIYKEMIDGFAAESYLENSDFYDDIKQHIKDFEKNVINKIQNLIFQFQEPQFKKDHTKSFDEMIISNWSEIDNFPGCSNQIFSKNFSQVKSIVKKKIGVEIELPEDFLENKKAIEISVDSKMLKNSNDRSLLVSNLMRGRDYIFDIRYTNLNVQLLYLYYSAADQVVEKILDLNFFINSIGANTIDKNVLLQQVDNCSETLKQLLLLGGNYEILEKFDIAQHMSVN